MQSDEWPQPQPPEPSAHVVDWYEAENVLQPEAEDDQFTIERYRQFARHLPAGAIKVLDIGCSTGRGGVELKRLYPDITLWGLDVVQSRLDALPPVYDRRVRGLSTQIPVEDGAVDVVLAGEFLEHLLARDVDATLCEFQRVLSVGGRLLLTTPNPAYLRLRVAGMSVYGPGHLTQHHVSTLRFRLKMARLQQCQNPRFGESLSSSRGTSTNLRSLR